MTPSTCSAQTNPGGEQEEEEDPEQRNVLRV